VEIHESVFAEAQVIVVPVLYATELAEELTVTVGAAAWLGAN
jgi:hypothetical protein